MSQSRKDDVFSIFNPNPPFNKKVKPFEHGRINAGFTILDKPGSFEPVAGVSYIWVLTQNQQIVVGIEKPWLYPQAFACDDTSWSQIQSALKADARNSFDMIASWYRQSHKDEKLRTFTEKRLEKYGGLFVELAHPTLTDAFNEKGEHVTSECTAYIGGELHFKNNEWIIDNKSGRFGRVNGKGIHVQRLMNEIAKKFEIVTGIRPKTRVLLPNETHLEAYCEIWNSGENEVDAALKLLQQFIDTERHLIFHSTHHRESDFVLAKQAMRDFEASSNLSIDTILNYFSDHLMSDDQQAPGSLRLRLEFIAGQTNRDFNENFLSPKIY